MNTWLEIKKNSDFSIHNIPFGVFSTTPHRTNARCGVALGDYVVDLNILQKSGFFNEIVELKPNIFAASTLNDFLSLSNSVCYKVRKLVQDLFLVSNEKLKSRSEVLEKVLIPSHQVHMLLPIEVKEYVDFYSSISHATNVGKMFRDEKNALLPNWKYIPIGYHGRASSIVVSGTNFHRPKGQIKKTEENPPIFAPSGQIDFELEMAFITNKKTQMGQTISPDSAKNYIFGLALFNDWSARDIQKWEYVPLGPFLGKSFASSLSPWIVTLDALEPFAMYGEEKDQEELDYLKCTQKGHYNINLEVYLKTEKSNENLLICQSNYKNMYWNLFQQLAHMSSNGSPINCCDVYASGTISGQDPFSFGSLLELCWKGTKPIKLASGEQRVFLQDGDTITFKGFAEKDGKRIGFGELTTTILPASTL